MRILWTHQCDRTCCLVQTKGWQGFKEKVHDRQCDGCGFILRCSFTLLCFLIIFTGFLCVSYFYSLKLFLYAFKNPCILNYDSSPKRAALVAQQWRIHMQRRRRRRQSPCWEDPLGERMATHCSILAWRIPWTEESGRRGFMGLRLKWRNTASPKSGKPRIASGREPFQYKPCQNSLNSNLIRRVLSSTKDTKSR